MARSFPISNSKLWQYYAELRFYQSQRHGLYATIPPHARTHGLMHFLIVPVSTTILETMQRVLFGVLLECSVASGYRFSGETEIRNSKCWVQARDLYRHNEAVVNTFTNDLQSARWEVYDMMAFVLRLRTRSSWSDRCNQKTRPCIETTHI